MWALGLIISLASFVVVGLFTAALSLGVVNEGYAIVVTRFGKTQYYTTAGFYRLTPFVEDCKTVNWTLSNCDSTSIKNAQATSSGTKIKLSSRYIPLHIVVHDIPSITCVTKDAVPIDVDMRFTSQITDPMAAVSPDAPTDLWNYLENVFQTALTDYVRTKVSDIFNPSHVDKADLISTLAKVVNAHCDIFGIKVESITIQNIGFSKIISDVQEKKKQATLEGELASLKLQQELLLKRMQTDMEIETADRLMQKDARLIKTLMDAGLNGSNIVQYMTIPKLGEKNPIVLSVGGRLAQHSVKEHAE